MLKIENIAEISSNVKNRTYDDDLLKLTFNRS
jgi:hypothetical protein